MKLKVIRAAVCVTALLGLVGCGSASHVVTLDEFNQISNGMSYSQVVSIVGAEGSLASSNYMDGVPGVMGSIDTRAYMWRNNDGSNMMCMFQNDRMMTKAQAGL